MYTDLVNKTILVTGAGQGIGNALCKRLAENGTNVIAITRSAEHLASLRAEYSSIMSIAVDLRDWSRTRECLADVPMLDGLVNNAAVAIIKPFEELSQHDIDETFDVNIKSVFNVTQVLSSKLKDSSSVVMVSSLAASRSFAGHSAYSATKAAVDSLTQSLALEWGSRKIRVNSVNPTVVLTKMGRDNWSDPKKSEPLLNHIPLHRFCEVPEVVDSIAYLLSNKSSFVNGHHLSLEGGYSVS